jgi:hypothetical protein
MAERTTHPGHPVKSQTIASDKQSALGNGGVTKGTGNAVRVTSSELNLGTGKYGSRTAGSRSDHYDWRKG